MEQKKDRVVIDILALIFTLILGLCGLGKSKGPLQWYRSEIIRVEKKEGIVGAKGR